jgi:ElaB/YqjD/DUF883 family membrane-anchored ribosome-binding protein
MSKEIALHRARPRTVEQARREVEASRERMADTLGEIEHRLVSKKQQIEHRMDVMRPIKQRVRSKPWVALAVAFGVGVVLWKMKNRDD